MVYVKSQYSRFDPIVPPYPFRILYDKYLERMVLNTPQNIKEFIYKKLLLSLLKKTR